MRRKDAIRLRLEVECKYPPQVAKELAGIFSSLTSKIVYDPTKLKLDGESYNKNFRFRT